MGQACLAGPTGYSRESDTTVRVSPPRQDGSPASRVRGSTAGIRRGGTLATAGNLVFQGNARENFVAYAADTGRARF